MFDADEAASAPYVVLEPDAADERHALWRLRRWFSISEIIFLERGFSFKDGYITRVQ